MTNTNTVAPVGADGSNQPFDLPTTLALIGVPAVNPWAAVAASPALADNKGQQ
jgi:hypothetical protein